MQQCCKYGVYLCVLGEWVYNQEKYKTSVLTSRWFFLYLYYSFINPAKRLVTAPFLGVSFFNLFWHDELTYRYDLMSAVPPSCK